MSNIACSNRHYGFLDLKQIRDYSDRGVVDSIVSDNRIMSTVSIFNGRAASSQAEIDQCTKMLCDSSYYDLGVGQYQILSRNNILGIVGSLVRETINDSVVSLEVGYLIVPEAHGRKVATDALQSLLFYLFNHISSLRDVFATTMESNKASQRVLSKNGFISLGVEDNYRVPNNGAKVILFHLQRSGFLRLSTNRS